MNRVTVVVAVAVAAALALAGCSSTDSLANSYNKTGDTGNYVSADGSTKTIAAADRGAAVAWSGTTDAGTRVSSSDYAGKVVVLNFWYASCPPCRLEAKDLEKLNTKYSAEGVVFLGVNVSDTGPTAQSFEQSHGMTYPSILDADQGAVKLAFTGKVAPNAVPTTLIIDGKGRVAARFSGLITSPSLVGQIIESTQAEKS
ncbi:MAG: TlpA family protein disulfide reductase [Actinomycetota bacterium]|nr:TlpA family protein disulfide reductase [Actinomycetota bacterium]